MDIRNLSSSNLKLNWMISKKYIIQVVIVLISILVLATCSKKLGASGGAFTSGGSVFSVGQYVGVVVNNKVQFYEWVNNGWQTDTNDDLTLPNGYKSVFGPGLFAEYVGVVVNNKVRFYKWLINGWQTDIDDDFTLPNGYKGVFGIGQYIGIVVNNKVQFYEWVNNGWQTDTDDDFTLPNGYKGVFSIGEYIGIVVNNKVQFYTWNYYGWQTDIVDDFTLPNNSSKQVGTNTQPDSGKSIKITGIDPKYHVFDLRLSNNADHRDDYIDVKPENVQASYSSNSGTFISKELRSEFGTGDIWTESGSYFVILTLNEGATYDTYVSKKKISFKKNVTEIAFSKFKFVERYVGQ